MFSISESLRVTSAPKLMTSSSIGPYFRLSRSRAANRSSTSARCSGEAWIPSGEIANGRADVLDADERGLQRGKSVLEPRLVTGEFLDLLASRAQAGSGGHVTFIEKIEGIHGRAIDFFGVGEDALLDSRRSSSPGLRPGVFNFALLISAQVQQAQAVLFVTLEFLDAGLNGFPRMKCFVNAGELASGEGIEQAQARGAIEGREGFVLRVDSRR